MPAATLALERTSAQDERPISSSAGTCCGASALAGELHLEIVATRAGFDALRSEWNDLFDRAGASIHLFQTFNWNWHWCNHYLPADAKGGGPTLAVLVGRRHGRAVMIWPLVVHKVAGLRQLSWMGEPVSQYGDVLVEPGPDREALLQQGWRFVKSQVRPDILSLRKVRADSNIAPFLGQIRANVTQSLVAPYLDLAKVKSFAEYEKRYSSKSRANRRRLMRRLEEQFAVAFLEHTSGPEARTLACTAIDLKRNWLKDRGLVAPAFADARFRDFFADIAAGEINPAGSRVSALTADGAPIALEIAIGCKDRVAMHVVVFDLAHEKAGVGVLLTEQKIRDAYRAGYGCYDLLAPGDSYKTDWADDAVKVEDWALATTLPGWLYAKAYLGFVRRHVKRVIGKLPLALRRRILP